MSAAVPRVASYPILSPNGLDYAAPHAYESEQVTPPDLAKDAIAVLHRLHGDNLVSQLLAEGKARFACTVVSPWCAYRKVEVAEGQPIASNGSVELQQVIRVATEEYSHPVMFQPSVLTTDEVNGITAGEAHGLDPLWHGETLAFPQAAQVAVQSFWNAKSTIQSILRLTRVSDGRLKPGSFEVQDVPEEGFYFLVEVEEELYERLRNPASFKHRDSIYAMALSQGLAILCDESSQYKERESWEDQQNLKLLFHMLKERELPTWEDGDAFRPNQVVAAFHPHKLDGQEEE